MMCVRINTCIQNYYAENDGKIYFYFSENEVKMINPKYGFASVKSRYEVPVESKQSGLIREWIRLYCKIYSFVP